MRKAPILLLTTTGSKTGKQRTTPVLYVKDENRLVIVASNGGSPKDPSWWTNLKGHPDARVQVKSEKFPVRARRATDLERKEYWPMLTEMYPSYNAYQEKTSRIIPVVILDPRES